MAEKTQVQMLCYDIEVSPNLGWYYPPGYDTRIIKVEDEWQVMCIAWKWMDEETVHFSSIQNQSEKQLLKEFAKVLDEADVVLGHNSDRFDMKKLNARFIKHNISKPSDVDQVDTLKIARGQFAFDSNRLNDLGEYLGVGGKDGTYATLWYDCLKGDKKSWELMKQYNITDVIRTEQVYLRLRGWAKTHVNMLKFRTEVDDIICRVCGSDHLVKKGWKPKATLWYRDMLCKSCGHRFKHGTGVPVKP